MRDFAFVDFVSVPEAKKVYDFFSKHGLLIEGSEVNVVYCRSGNRPSRTDLPDTSSNIKAETALNFNQTTKLLSKQSSEHYSSQKPEKRD